jgi:hypothetical protein
MGKRKIVFSSLESFHCFRKIFQEMFPQKIDTKIFQLLERVSLSTKSCQESGCLLCDPHREEDLEEDADGLEETLHSVAMGHTRTEVSGGRE